ncbi:uncharacterized protein LOC142658988 [Rhinoderma darwinii]|uniref:uncharacterized protein LOC142658988 n=1 Tax=Rhinoderma darwinii TaxID=43563 RepID=UPI003F66FA77
MSCKTLSFKNYISEQDLTEAAGEDPSVGIRTTCGTPVHSRAGAASHKPRVTKKEGSTDQGDPRAVRTAQRQDNITCHTEDGQNDPGRTIHRRLVTALSQRSAHSEVELSDSSESSENPGSVKELEQQMAAESQDQISKVAEDDGLIGQITDLIAVLQECDEVDQLVLRNTGMTDALLHHLALAISSSKSEVESINLNLNEIGPEGAKTIVHLLQDKPCVKRLLLYGNQLGAAGIKTIMAGLSDASPPVWGTQSISSSNVSSFQLSELDIGGNQMGRGGLRSVAAFLKRNPPLTQLCLAQSSVPDINAWAELFDAIKVNTKLTHLLLDENSLGDPGAKLLAEVIHVNRSLISLDLDGNNIGEDGARAIIESLRSSSASTLTNISLEDNPVSVGTINTITRSLMIQRVQPEVSRAGGYSQPVL